MELQDYLRVLRSHWLGITIIVLVTLGATAAYTATRPAVYSASATGFVSTGAADSTVLASVSNQVAISRATSYVALGTSRTVAQMVINELGLSTDPTALVQQIKVTQPPSTVLLEITADGPTPEAAQQLADAWVKALAEEVQSIEDPNNTGAPGTPRVVPVASAELPTSPSSPKPLLNGVLGLAVGLLLGFAYALTRHTLDRRLRSAEDIERVFGIPVAGQVPTAKWLSEEASVPDPLAESFQQGDLPSAGAAEAFRKLRTNLLYMDVDNPPRRIVVTSPNPNDGKSTVAAHLAEAIAASGEKVVLVDADLRRPTIAGRLGLIGSAGLTDVLVGRMDVEDALQSVAGHVNLKILAAGEVPPNPSELLGSRAMASLMDKLAESAIVILDVAPLLPVTDAAVLTHNADGALLVISAGKTLDRELETALRHLDAVKARPLGVIMNKVATRGTGGHYYSSYYGQPGSQTPAAPVPAELPPSVRQSHETRSA